MANSLPQQDVQVEQMDFVLLLKSYCRAIAELTEKNHYIAQLENDKEQNFRKYNEAIAQYHQLKERYDHQYSQQYQQYAALPIPCYSWQEIEGTWQLFDFNPAAAQFSRETLQQTLLTIGHQPEDIFFGFPALYRHLLSCANHGQSSSHRLKFEPLKLYLRVEYVFIEPDQILMYILDESEQIQTERALRSKARQQSAIAKLGETSLTFDNLNKLLQQAVVSVARTLKLPYCSIYKLQANRSTCLLQAGYGWPVDLVGAVTAGIQADQSHVGYTFAQQNPVIAEDLPIETRFKVDPLLHNYRIMSSASVIIGQPDQPWGILGVYSLEVRSFTEDQLYFLQAIANIISSSVRQWEQAEQMNLLHRSIDAIDQGVVITDPRQANNPTIYVNRGFEKITGYPKEDILGKNCNFLQGRDRQQEGTQKLRESVLKGQPYRTQLRNYRKTGECFLNELQIFPVRDQEGFLTNFIGIQTDVTDQKAAEAHLRKSENQFRQTFNLAPIGMAITDLHGQYTEVNQAWCDILGYQRSELLVRSYRDVTHPDDLATDETLNLALQTGEKTEFQREKRFLAKNGRVVHTLMQAVLVTENSGKPLHVIRQMVDISDRKQMEQQLVHDALYDTLTNLPNRTLLHERLSHAIRHHQRYPDYNFAVLFLDLDHFKWVNDSLGHHTGDLLLQEFSQRVKACLRETDTLARLGGDEFVILLDEIHQPSYAIQVSDRIHQVLRQPFHLANQELFIEVSIGILQGHIEYDSPESILRDADVAMYQAKSKGRARSEIFDTALQQQVFYRRHLEQELREAIANDGLTLHYQRIMNLHTGQWEGIAARLDWEHPEKGWVATEEFLAIAEETGLMNPLSRWLIETACIDLNLWQNTRAHQDGDRPFTPLRLHLPISSKQLRGRYLLDLLKAIPEQYDLQPAQLVLECQETVLNDAEQEFRQQLAQLRQFGIKIYFDSFEQSNLSLSSLYQQLIHGIIIQPLWLTEGGGFGQDAKDFIEAMIRLAQSLNLEILAKDIQTEQQYRLLTSLNCSFGQGRYWGDWQTAAALNAHLEPTKTSLSLPGETR